MIPHSLYLFYSVALQMHKNVCRLFMNCPADEQNVIMLTSQMSRMRCDCQYWLLVICENTTIVKKEQI